MRARVRVRCPRRSGLRGGEKKSEGRRASERASERVARPAARPPPRAHSPFFGDPSRARPIQAARLHTHAHTHTPPRLPFGASRNAPPPLPRAHAAPPRPLLARSRRERLANRPARPTAPPRMAPPTVRASGPPPMFRMGPREGIGGGESGSAIEGGGRRSVGERVWRLRRGGAPLLPRQRPWRADAPLPSLPLPWPRTHPCPPPSFPSFPARCPVWCWRPWCWWWWRRSQVRGWGGAGCRKERARGGTRG